MHLNLQRLRKVSGKKMLAGVLILGVIVSMAALNLARSKKQAGIPVKVAKTEIKPIQDNVFASGRVRLTQKQELYNYTSTTVRELFVSPGDQVQKGQVLGLLDPVDLEDKLNEARVNFNVQESNLNKAIYPRDEEVAQERASYQRAEADYRNAQKEYERTKVLFEQGAVSAKDLEDAELEKTVKEAEYKRAGEGLTMKETGPTGHERESLQAQVEQARLQVEQAEKNLNRTVLRAEMDGVVTAVEVMAGDFVQMGTLLMTIGDAGQLEVTAGVSEADSGRLMPGQKVAITAAAQPNREYTGIVQSVSPAAVAAKTAENGSQIEVPVIVKMECDIEGLRPGYTVDLSINVVDKENALVVPYEAVMEKEGLKQVFVIENQVARLKDVATGVDTALFTEILSGLSEGDTVVVSPIGTLMDGMRVNEIANQPPSNEGATTL
ncbi:Macrolide export protein MacA [Pelotomaculum schinkii]|uniref:Macrolide export protein MacA n=1 Tax=Pelotomaculum schinkii TaxID=78350 RepID=A0A4Y7RJL0_9FIRM|nr:efflux RND transporter periplasmic adaptor subunit [Pelotomaculum schinkii]TEB08517.1 Macrolide export protein MacA [Pelotomaculum schinkii]